MKKIVTATIATAGLATMDMMHKPQNKITMDIILMTLNHTAIRIQLMHKVIIITLGQEIGIQVN